MRLQHGLAIFWATHVIPVVALYFLVDNETFQRLTLLYITLASIWANVASHWAAAKAVESGTDSTDPATGEDGEEE